MSCVLEFIIIIIISVRSDGARFDVSCRNLWSPLDKAFINVRVFNPQAESNWKEIIQQIQTEYMPRTIQVEKGSLTAAVFSTLGWMGDKLVRQSSEVEPEERRTIL